MKIGLLGHGVVGSGVRKIIDDHLTDETKQLEVVKILVKDESEICDDRMTLKVDEVVNHPEIDVVAECMGGLEPAHTFVRQALLNGKHVVTSNKKMLATFAQELFEIAHEKNVQLCYEASVGGGIPWIHEIQHVRQIDEIDCFEGIFNGTTNYILSQMADNGEDFEPMLKEAQALGYAERNPSDDIDGFDVRYKTALSSLAAFGTYVKPEDIITFGIRSIHAIDMTWAKEHGYVMKLIGKGIRTENGLDLSVIPTMVKTNSFFANIPLNFNALSTDSKTLGKAVYIGQGAGSLPTAHAVVQDMIQILKNDVHFHDEQQLSLTTPHIATYYVRSSRIDNVRVPDMTRIDEKTVLLHNVSLTELHRLVEELADEQLFVAEVEQ